MILDSHIKPPASMARCCWSKMPPLSLGGGAVVRPSFNPSFGAFRNEARHMRSQRHLLDQLYLRLCKRRTTYLASRQGRRLVACKLRRSTQIISMAALKHPIRSSLENEPCCSSSPGDHTMIISSIFIRRQSLRRLSDDH